MASLAFNSATAPKEVTLLNVSKCSVPELRRELEAYGAFGEEEERAWQAFKDIETQLWLADHKARQELDDDEATDKEGPERKDPAEPEEAESRDSQIVPATGSTATENKQDSDDWSWGDIQRGKCNSTFGLTFQDIQSWNLLTLRQELKSRGIFEKHPPTADACKLFEGLMAKLVTVLMDPKRERMAHAAAAGDDGVAASGDFAEVQSRNAGESKNTMASKQEGGEEEKAESDNAPTQSASQSELRAPRVRSGAEINLDNLHTLSIYELRQELERRDAFAEFKSGAKKISHKNLMRHMMALLLEDKQAKDDLEAETLEDPEVIRARLAEARAKRKAEAVARSKARMEQRQRELEALKVAEAEGEGVEPDEENRNGEMSGEQ